MDWGLPGFSIHGIFQVRIQEWVCHFLLYMNNLDQQKKKREKQVEDEPQEIARLINGLRNKNQQRDWGGLTTEIGEE